jgi:uncharacterized protein
VNSQTEGHSDVPVPPDASLRFSQVVPPLNGGNTMMRKIGLLGCMVGVFLLPGPGGVGDALGEVRIAELRPATASGWDTLYTEVIRQEDVMVPMRDGVRLATDIHRPGRDGRPVEDRLPVLMQRTPYGKDSYRESAQVEAFVKSGYVVIVQDVRGRYDSEGTFVKYFEYDAYDGYDTMEWASRLPYSTGRIGTWGTSYGAHTQSDPSKLNPASLGTMVLNFGGLSNSWRHSVRNHGAFELGFQQVWAFRQLRGETDDPKVAEMLETETPNRWFSAQPLRKGLNPLSVVPNFEDYLLSMATRGNADDWRGLGLNWEDYYEQTADVPMIHIGGWYDVFAGSTIDNYLGLSPLKSSPVRLLMGPWDHGGNSRTHAGDVEFGAAAAIPDFSIGFHLRWFDHFLKGQETGVLDGPPVRLFVMGTGDGHKDANGRLHHGGYWRDADAWPVPGVRFVNYYFQPDGGLAPSLPSAGPEATTFTFDPANPVPSIGKAYNIDQGGFHQQEDPRFFGSKPPYLPLKARRDIAVFQTEPLQEDVEVIGPIVVKLFASSTAVDTDFTVKLVDVYPPSDDYPSGYDLNLTDGIIRARYRNSPNDPELMVPGTIYEFEIEPFPTASVFKRGNRIRIDVSSSNFPKFDVNPNTGEPLGQHRRMIQADNTIYHNPINASHVILPIAPPAPRDP